MSHHYSPLSNTQLIAGTTYLRPRQQLPERVGSNDPATYVMTDLTKVAAMTIGPCASIDQANQRMIASGVRLLLVTDQHHAILGIITATDLFGERPMRYLQEVGGKREDIFVRDIMTGSDHLEVLYMVDVATARVGDIVETLRRASRQHALVVDLDEKHNQVVRGIFSTKQISKQLGMEVESRGAAASFAELASSPT